MVGTGTGTSTTSGCLHDSKRAAESSRAKLARLVALHVDGEAVAVHTNAEALQAAGTQDNKEASTSEEDAVTSTGQVLRALRPSSRSSL